MPAGDDYADAPHLRAFHMSAAPQASSTSQGPNLQRVHETSCGLLREIGSAELLADHATSFFLRVLEIRPGDRVAEPGCGTGVLSVYAALAGAAAVTGTDILPEALAFARENARLNGQAQVTFVEGHLLDPVPGPLDCVAALLPHKPAPRAFHTRFYGGADGTDLLLAVIAQARDKLVRGGRLALYANSIAHPKRVTREFSRGFSVRLLGEKKRYFTAEEFDGLTPGLFKYLENQLRKGEAEFSRDEKGWYFWARIFEGTRE
jgi:16S rRNA G1207 methylase RsmC